MTTSHDTTTTINHRNAVVAVVVASQPPRQTGTHSPLISSSFPSPSPPSSSPSSSSLSPSSSCPFQTSRSNSLSTALNSSQPHRSHGPSFSSFSPDLTISTSNFSPSSSLSPSTSRFSLPTPTSSSSSNFTTTITTSTTPSSTRRLSFQAPEQVHPLAPPMNTSMMISTTTISHPQSMPSPMSPSSPSPASPPSLSFGGPHNQNNNSRPLLATRSSSTSHCPPMLPRPRSYSSDPIPGATPMSSSTSLSNLLKPNHHKVNPNIAHLSSVAMNMSRRPSLPANHPLMHHHHPMERQRSYDPRRQPPGFYLQQQALLQEQFEQQRHQEQQGLQAQQQQIQQPSAPSPAPVPLQRPALTPLSPPRSLSSLSSTSTMVSSLSSSSISSTLSSSTLTTVSTRVRHPLWQLDCKSCKTTLCKQAMLGHLAGDPDKKLFSTNLAVGVLALPDRPLFIHCPCKFHLFACAGCGSVCGYKLVQPCEGCETNRGNGHFWIFYAHEVVSHWRRIKDEKNDNVNGIHAVIKTTAATVTAMTIEIVEMESAIEAVDRKGLLDGTRPHTPTTSAGYEQSANDTDKLGAIATRDVDVEMAMATCQLTSAAGYTVGDEGAEGGRLMYWDDLPTWEGQRQGQSQSEGNVGR